MSMQQKRDSDFSCEVIQVLRSERLDHKNRLDLRVAKWSRSKERVLEKRRVWEKKDGTITVRRAVGLTKDDVRFIYENYAELINLL
jgi:hypothetical protein